MQLSIGEFRSQFCAYLDEMIEPIHVVNTRFKSSPTEAVVVSPELWQVLMSQPGAKKRVREFVDHHEQRGEAAA